MVLVSLNVSVEFYEWKKEKRLSWAYIMEKGREALVNSAAIAAIVADYEELKKKQARTAELLQKYADEAQKLSNENKA